MNQWPYETFSFYALAEWFWTTKKKKTACELRSYLHFRNPDDTENTFPNVHLIMAQTVRPQKTTTAKIDGACDFLDLFCVIASHMRRIKSM